MTNPPSYTLLNVTAGRSQGILTVMGRLDLDLDQLYSSVICNFGLARLLGKFQQYSRQQALHGSEHLYLRLFQHNPWNSTLNLVIFQLSNSVSIILSLIKFLVLIILNIFIRDKIRENISTARVEQDCSAYKMNTSIIVLYLAGHRTLDILYVVELLGIIICKWSIF